MMPIEEKTDADWEAENDARTLMEANIIMKDEERMKKAQEAAERLAKEKKEEAESMSAVSKFSYPDMG